MRNTRKHKKRMVGGAHYKRFVYEFKVGFSLLGYDPNANTNIISDVDDDMVSDNTDVLVEIFTKRLSKAIELGEIKHIQNIEFVYIEDTYFQLFCEIDIDEIADRVLFIEDTILEIVRSNDFDSQIPDLPALDVGHYNNEEGGEEYARSYSEELIKNINISDINEFEVETAERGRNLAALKTGFTKGTKTDPTLRSGLANLPPTVLQHIGSYLSGKKGTLNEQRLSLRANAGYNNEPKAAGGAGAPAGGRRRRVLTRRRL